MKGWGHGTGGSSWRWKEQGTVEGIWRQTAKFKGLPALGGMDA